MADRCECCDLLADQCTRAEDAIAHPERDDPSEDYRHDQSVATPAHPRRTKARFAGRCARCRKQFEEGDSIIDIGGGWEADCCYLEHRR